MTDSSSSDFGFEVPAEGDAPLGRLDVYGMSHIGRERAVNEDQFLIADLNKSMRVHQTSLGLDHKTRLFGGSQGKLLVVADGMGGHEAGERASTLAVDSLAMYMLNTMRWLFRLEEDSDDDFQADLKSAMEHCQARLAAEVEVIPQRQGMGTTLTMAYIIWPRLYVVHAGDSRCYLHRNSILKQLTRDHTMQELFKENLDVPVEGDAPHEPDASRWAHVLWNFVGGDSEELTAEVYRADLALNDALLLCTDGLTKHISDDEIQQHLDSDHSSEEICQTLIDEANERGGSDNITVIVAKFSETTKNVEAAAAEAEIGSSSNADPLADTEPHINVAPSPDKVALVSSCDAASVGHALHDGTGSA